MRPSRIGVKYWGNSFAKQRTGRRPRGKRSQGVPRIRETNVCVVEKNRADYMGLDSRRERGKGNTEGVQPLKLGKVSLGWKV